MRVLLADGQIKVRSALRLLLEHEPEIYVVGEAAEANSLLDQAKHTCPEIILLDYELPGQKIAQLLSALRGRCPNARIIALSGRPESRCGALRAGVDAFVSKGDPPDRLLATLSAMNTH